MMMEIKRMDGLREGIIRLQMKRVDGKGVIMMCKLKGWNG